MVVNPCRPIRAPGCACIPIDRKEVVVCPEPFTCDYMLANGTANVYQHTLCQQALVNPTRDAQKCAAWDSVYGFFTGDDAGATAEVVLQIIDMVRRCRLTSG